MVKTKKELDGSSQPPHQTRPARIARYKSNSVSVSNRGCKSLSTSRVGICHLVGKNPSLPRRALAKSRNTPTTNVPVPAYVKSVNPLVVPLRVVSTTRYAGLLPNQNGKLLLLLITLLKLSPSVEVQSGVGRSQIGPEPELPLVPEL